MFCLQYIYCNVLCFNSCVILVVGPYREIFLLECSGRGRQSPINDSQIQEYRCTVDEQTFAQSTQVYLSYSVFWKETKLEDCSDWFGTDRLASSSCSFRRLSRLVTNCRNVGRSVGSMSQHLFITCSKYWKVIIHLANLDNSFKFLLGHPEIRDVVWLPASQDVSFQRFVPRARVSPENWSFSILMDYNSLTHILLSSFPCSLCSLSCAESMDFPQESATQT